MIWLSKENEEASEMNNGKCVAKLKMFVPTLQENTLRKYTESVVSTLQRISAALPLPQPHLQPHPPLLRHLVSHPPELWRHRK